MLEHLQRPQPAARVVILGAAGFVGHALHQRLKQDKVEVLALTRHEVDLSHPTAIASLSKILREDDVLVMTAAVAPCKDAAMLYCNIQMMQVVCEVLKEQTVRQVIYISSDAVYADSSTPLTETSITAPTSLHGVMHLAREMMLQSVCSRMPFAILRCSLLYGLADPHNGYGPNSFRRLAADNQCIVLFGQGEERRDHVYIDDVAEIITRAIQYRSRGLLNIASGCVTSFREIAEKIVSIAENKVEIRVSPRTSPMPHNGYRAFDVMSSQQALPGFSYTSIDEGLKLMQLETVEINNES